MVIIRNNKLVENRKRIGFALNAIGLLILMGGFLIVVGFGENSPYIRYSFLSIPAGWLMSQIGLFFTNRYSRPPRADLAIDEGFKHAGKGAFENRLYHYIGPVPHLLLSEVGIIGIVSKYQAGKISVDEYKWKQQGVGLLRRIFGQELLGNPAWEAEIQIKNIARFIGKEVPELAETELPITAFIVFTREKNEDLDLKKSTIPAMHSSRLGKFWNKRKKDTPMASETYELLKERFDAVAERRTGLSIEALEE